MFGFDPKHGANHAFHFRFAVVADGIAIVVGEAKSFGPKIQIEPKFTFQLLRPPKDAPALSDNRFQLRLEPRMPLESTRPLEYLGIARIEQIQVVQ